LFPNVKGFSFVNQIKAYLFLFFLFSVIAANAQKADNLASPLSFPDSIRIVRENTRSVDATVVGSAFATAWPSLTSSQQTVIQDQVRLMRKKRISLKPGLINYFGAVANAVTVEQADAAKI